MKSGLFLSALLAATFPLTLAAQQAPNRYHTVTCIKLKPGITFADYRHWVEEGPHKVQQANADSGRISAWYQLEYFMPAGTSAPCDFVNVAIFPGPPPAPLTLEDLAAALKKAGITMGAKEFADKRSSMAELVFAELWENWNAVGTLQKGDYVVLNHMKVPNLSDWVAYEKKMWQPFAEAMVKDGVMRGWFLNIPVYPGGSDLKYQAATVDVYPGWDALFKDNGFAERFKKVHPDADMNQTFASFEKLRTIGSMEVLRVEDVVLPAK
jgi:hypothetical protein